MRAVQPCVCISCCCCWLHGAAPCSRQPEGTEPEPSEPRAPAGCSVAAPRLSCPPRASRDRHEKQHGRLQVSGKHRHHWCVWCPLDGSEGVRAAAGSGCKNFLFFSVAQALGLLRRRMHQAKRPALLPFCWQQVSPAAVTSSLPWSTPGLGTKGTKPPVPVPARSPRQGPGAAKHAPPWQPAAASGFCSSKASSGKRWRGNRKAHEGAQRPRRSAAASSFSLLSCLRCWWRRTWAWVGCRGRRGGRDVSPVI